MYTLWNKNLRYPETSWKNNEIEKKRSVFLHSMICLNSYWDILKRIWDFPGSGAPLFICPVDHWWGIIRSSYERKFYIFIINRERKIPSNCCLLTFGEFTHKIWILVTIYTPMKSANPEIIIDYLTK